FEADPKPDAPKVFVCVPYSYQNAPLHLGHGFTYTRGDAYARFKRMQGYNVLFPWAWHWTGEAVAGTCERLKRGDEAVRRMLVEIDGVPEDVLDKFTDPAYVTRYYTEENREVVKAMGFSIDWRREFYTTDLHPYYSKFIQWQYITLKKLGYVTMGRHPVVWCPKCESPTGDHDRLVGEGVSPEEYTLVYFKLDEYDAFLAAATLRPETIFGVTNIWVNPESVYALIEADGQRLIVSREAAEKLKHQMKVKVLREIEADELIGKYAETPLTGVRVPVLPADLVDPKFGSGVVYSVPAHAPYDYAGVIALKRNEERLRKYGIREVVESIKPISIIRVPGYGEYPAVEEVERLGITSDTDPRLDDATKTIYSKEFHSGVLKENCGEYAGKTVAEARDLVKERLIELGLGGVMWELPEKVVCRCGTETIVKIVENQWFLRYSDPEWKEKVKQHIMEMNIYPEEARQWFINVVDWLRDWACARKTGLGTRLPWDPEWIVETLSDSTIYPALYTISKYLNLGMVKPEQLTVEVLDYVFRGIGDPAEISRKAGIEESILRQMREEFLYWYPVDMRISAKELVPNHLTFYLFQHVAIFEPRLWPRGIGVNGMVKIEGEKMSKSKGNFIPLKKAIQLYGADTTRATLLLAAEDLDDPDWRDKNAREVRSMLDIILRTCREVASTDSSKSTEMDSWLLSILQKRIKSITSAMENLKTRTAISEAIYGLYNDWRWYLRRNGGAIGEAARRFVEDWVKLLAPFIPFTAEECWSLLGKNSLVSVERWPEPDESLIDEARELEEDLLKRLMEDIRSIIEVYGKKPQKIIIYVAADEKRKVLDKALEILDSKPKNPIGELIKWMISQNIVERKKAPTLAKLIFDTLTAYTSNYKPETLRRVAESELSFYHKAAEFLEQEFSAKIEVYREGEPEIYDPKNKAASALPLRPGIYLE
ncbi:MAG: leucine--tRNA ligase, partial [Thaumarchaeota archaeon]|nr:leucine--tRNA ligase [Nitrososphaerota archaeon]